MISGWILWGSVIYQAEYHHPDKGNSQVGPQGGSGVSLSELSSLIESYLNISWTVETFLEIMGALLEGTFNLKEPASQCGHT